MKIMDLFLIAKLTPLSDVVGKIEDNRYVADGLYRVSEHLYLVASKFHIDKVKTDPVGPYVVGFLCAADDSAAKRVATYEIEQDSGQLLSCPSELLPPDSVPTYAGILAGLQRQKPKVCLELAQYRVATDGKFIHRSIETERYVYYFRSNKEDALEPPYAIRYKLLNAA